MISIRFIAVDYSQISIVHNLANNLSSKQNEFRFLAHDGVLSLPSRAATSLDSLEHVERIAKELCLREYPDEYPIVICNRKFQSYKFAKISDDVTVITTCAWPATSSPHLLQNYIAYAVVDALMSRYVQYPAHTNRKRCVADVWSKANDVKEGLANCEYCYDCRSRILQTIGTGISLQQVAAIFRILDHVADRKTCFVIMPFDKGFNAIYAKLKRTLIKHNWVCRRADKIFETREVMTLIWEEILRSDLIIADLTRKNANVFYELGYAHAVDKRTILITQSLKDVPFDLRHRQLVEYAPRGLKQLAHDIVQYL